MKLELDRDIIYKFLMPLLLTSLVGLSLHSYFQYSLKRAIVEAHKKGLILNGKEE